MEHIKNIVVLTNGCFDILHEGHIKLLKECRKLGSHVIVVLNTDTSVKLLKGETRPFNTYDIREANLKATGYVDDIYPFNTDKELIDLIKAEQPDILVKGSDYKGSKVVGENEMKEWNGEIHFVEISKGFSTTTLGELRNKKFLITGGFGFIGSSFIKYLNSYGIKDITILEIINENEGSWQNVADLIFKDIIDIKKAKWEIEWHSLDFIINLGASSSTTQSDLAYLLDNNTRTSNELFEFNCPQAKIIHASSAAVYGDTENFTERTENIKPLNAYGFSKLLTDRFFEREIAKNNELKAYALRFFNVYGEREAFKFEQKSFISKAISIDKDGYNSNNKFQLFKSIKAEYNNGDQFRDFIYIDDVCKVMMHFILNDVPSGIYNVGTGRAISFNEICKIINAKRPIEYIDMPQKLIPIYQSYTKADLTKLRKIGGYTDSFITIKEGSEKMRKNN